MKIGVFVPIGNNGWLISTHAPQYMPTFELNKAIVQKAEHYHFDSRQKIIEGQQHAFGTRHACDFI